MDNLDEKIHTDFVAPQFATTQWHKLYMCATPMHKNLFNQKKGFDTHGRRTRQNTTGSQIHIVRFAFMLVYHMTIYNDCNIHDSFIKSQLSENYCINIYVNLLLLPLRTFTTLSCKVGFGKNKFFIRITRLLYRQFLVKTICQLFNSLKTIVYVTSSN